jgi:hypothetical protein
VPPEHKSWTDWNVARAHLSGRRNMMFISDLCYGYTEVMRMLKNGSPHISLHDLDDVIGINADSVRLFVAPEGAIEGEGGDTSGEALSQAGMQAATERAKEKAKDKTEKKLFGPLAPVIPDDPPKERMLGAVKSLAFDILRAIDESTPPEALEHSIEVARERITRLGSGKSGGYRTIIAYSAGRRAVFLFGFAKNQRDNLTPVQLADLKMVGRDFLALTEHQINEAVAAGRLQEVRYDEED